VQKAFGYAKKPHCFAIMKRGVVFVAGRRALYVRLPSERGDAPAFRITFDNITSDWLEDPGNKAYLDKFHSGIHELPPDFDMKVSEEQKLLEEALQMKGSMTMTDYVKRATDLFARQNTDLLATGRTRTGGRHRG
jgi:hypothetical protein